MVIIIVLAILYFGHGGKTICKIHKLAIEKNIVDFIKNGKNKFFKIVEQPQEKN